MTPPRRAWGRSLGRLAALLALLCVAPRGLDADGDVRAFDGLKVLELRNVKVQWFGAGEEQLPCWINARFVFEALGTARGVVTETDLDQDGNDEDGDPSGFDTYVYSDLDGSLKDVGVRGGAFTFTTFYGDADAGVARYVLAPSPDASGGWTLQAESRNDKGASRGKNRFDLVGERRKGGVLSIGPDPNAASYGGGSQPGSEL